jgi:hypothetical protein
MVAVFAIGHIGATLLVAGGLWIALRAHAVAASVVDAEDVGVSYGFLAVASAATCLLARPLRAPWLGGLLVYALSDMLTPVSFTDFGHLAAVLIGIACTPLVRRAAGTVPSMGLGSVRHRRRPAGSARRRSRSLETPARAEIALHIQGRRLVHEIEQRLAERDVGLAVDPPTARGRNGAMSS